MITVNTKQFCDALNLGVINSNVTKFFEASQYAQLVQEAASLRINLQNSKILTEVNLPGQGDGSHGASIVDCLKLKQLATTLTTETIQLDFSDNALIIKSGKSSFSLPKFATEDDMELERPIRPDNFVSLKFDQDTWKFVKDHQMFAIGMSFINPVYNYVYCGQDGSNIVGDYDNSIFTMSDGESLGRTLLLTDDIINLLISVPEDTELSYHDNQYYLSYQNDSYSYLARFTPELEETVGSYSSDAAKMAMEPQGGYVKADVSSICKLLSQADILSSGSDRTITLSYENGVLNLKDTNIDGSLEVIDEDCMEFSCVFKTNFLKSFFATFVEGSVNISPSIQNDSVIAIIVWNDAMVAVIGGADI